MPTLLRDASPTNIVTERLRLRPFCAEDLEAMHELCSDPRALRYGAFAPHHDVHETRRWLDGKLSLPASEGEDLVMELDGKAIGKVGFPAFPFIGVLIHPRHWGRGLAGEAVSAILDRGFGLHGLPLIKANIDQQNMASLRLFERLGFIEVGRASRTLQIGDRWCDSVFMELAAGRWHSRPSS